MMKPTISSKRTVLLSVTALLGLGSSALPGQVITGVTLTDTTGPHKPAISRQALRGDSRLRGEKAVAALKQSGQYESLRSAFREAEHKVQPQGAGFRLQNPENDLQAEFHDGAMTAEHSAARFGLRLEAYGYGDRPGAPAPATIHAAGTTVEYRRGLLNEWYRNDPRGLEQGFTLGERPAKPDGGPLAIELAVSSGLQAVAAGDHIELQRHGQTVLLYTGLRAWDAAGRALDARMVVHDARIRLEVADREAVYPVAVDPWIQQQELTAADGVIGDVFGYSVSVDGDTAVIGNPLKNDPNIPVGAAYVFVRSSGAWSQQAELTPADAGSQFGYSVSESGDTAVIGALQVISNGYLGAAYVFTRSAGVWSQQAELTAADGGPSDDFGVSVSVNGDTAVIGADSKRFGQNRPQGAAYVFTRSAGVWSQQAELTAADGVPFDSFGQSVSVSGDTAVIGASSKNSFQGAAYVFTRSAGVWSQQAELTALDGASGDYFGSSVSVNGDTAVIGAESKNMVQGAAYVFTRSAGIWSLQAELTALDGAGGDQFGASVSVDGDTAVIGTYNNRQGTAYVFLRSAGVWSQQQKLTAADGAIGDDFGQSVSVSGGTAVIGAISQNSNQGAAYVYQLLPMNTPPGMSVAVDLSGGSTAAGGVSLMFGTVTAAGDTAVAIGNSGPPPPSGFTLGSPAISYSLTTTAIYSGSITLCFNYVGISFLSGPQLFHFEGGAWTNVTTSVDAVHQIICGSVNSLSPFAIFSPKLTATVTLSNLQQTYTGAALTPTATTVPANLSIVWTGAPDTNVGAYPVTATVMDPNYMGSASGIFAIISIRIGNIPTNAIYGGSFIPTYIYFGHGETYSKSDTTAVCRANGDGTIVFTGAGTCTLVAHATDLDTKNKIGLPQSFTVAPAATTIGIKNIPANAKVYGSFTAAYAYPAVGGGTPSVTSSTAATCAVSGNVVNFVFPGTCTLTAQATAGADYTATTGSAQSFTIAKATTTIGISDIPATAAQGGTLTLTYAYLGDGTASSTSRTPAVCTVSGATVTYVKAGTCTLRAAATAGPTYAAVTGPAQSFTIN